jgi:hypothetical protein
MSVLPEDGFCRPKHVEKLQHKLLMNICAVSWNKYNILLMYCTEHVQY